MKFIDAHECHFRQSYIHEMTCSTYRRLQPLYPKMAINKSKNIAIETIRGLSKLPV